MLSDLDAIPEDKVTSALAQCQGVMSLFRGIGPIVQRYERMLSVLIEAFESQQQGSSEIEAPLDQESPAELGQAPPSVISFDMDMSFNADLFPGIAESGLLDGPSNILSPTYWMNGGQTRRAESTGNGDCHDGQVSTSSTARRG